MLELRAQDGLSRHLGWAHGTRVAAIERPEIQSLQRGVTKKRNLGGRVIGPMNEARLSGADRPTGTRDSQTRASPPDWIPGQPRENHTADGEYDEHAAAQGMTRLEEHDADHDNRHGGNEQDQAEETDAADISCRHRDGHVAAGSRAARPEAVPRPQAPRPGSAPARPAVRKPSSAAGEAGAEGRRRPANGARAGVLCSAAR